MQRTGVERKKLKQKKNYDIQNEATFSLKQFEMYLLLLLLFLFLFFFNLISCNVKMIKTNCKETSFSATISNLASYLMNLYPIHFMQSKPIKSNSIQSKHSSSIWKFLDSIEIFTQTQFYTE